jgi:predicted RecA/RadA family phage recombinase
MSQNFLQPGNHITIAASPYDVEPGQGVVPNSLFGIASGAVASGEEVVVAVEGVFELPKVSVETFAVGAPVYYDTTDFVATTTTSGTTKIGVAVKAAVSGDLTVEVRLHGAWGA